MALAHRTAVLTQVSADLVPSWPSVAQTQPTDAPPGPQGKPPCYGSTDFSGLSCPLVPCRNLSLFQPLALPQASLGTEQRAFEVQSQEEAFFSLLSTEDGAWGQQPG